MRFSAAIAFATAAWMVQTQGDKAILSKVLPLADFGVFALAVTATAAVAGLSGPIGQALLPRLTRMIAEDDAAAVNGLYRRTTQLACLIAMPPAMLLLFFAEPALWAWTGDRAVAHQAAPILQAYAAGSGLLPLSAFPYYLQYAHGQLRLHVVGQAVVLPILVVGLLAASVRYGAVGCGVVWTGVVAGTLILYAPVVHRRFLPGLHGRWMLVDIAPIAGATALCAALLALVLRPSEDRALAAGQLALVGAFVLMAGVAASTAARAWLATTWRAVAGNLSPTR